LSPPSTQYSKYHSVLQPQVPRAYLVNDEEGDEDNGDNEDVGGIEDDENND